MKAFMAVMLNIWLACVVSGCFAMPNGVGVEQTVAGMRSAVAGMPGTFAYLSKASDYVLLGWPVGKEYAFVILDSAGKVVRDWKNLMGTAAEAEEAAKFLSYIERHGWQQIPVGMIAPAVVAEIKQASFSLWLSRIPVPVVLVLPSPVWLDPQQIINPVVAQ